MERSSNGKWENILDIGVEHQGPYFRPDSVSIFNHLVKPNGSLADFGSLKKAELKFEEKFRSLGNLAYATFLSPRAIICRNGKLPIKTKEGQNSFIEEKINVISDEVSDGEISSAGDLGYFYGVEKVLVTRNGKTETKKACYLRVWKLDGEGWKIVLDVLNN